MQTRPRQVRVWKRAERSIATAGCGASPHSHTHRFTHTLRHTHTSSHTLTDTFTHSQTHTRSANGSEDANSGESVVHVDQGDRVDQVDQGDLGPDLQGPAAVVRLNQSRWPNACRNAADELLNNSTSVEASPLSRHVPQFHSRRLFSINPKD